ncbi:3-oxoacyl-ACP synthase [Cereibacter sphaeroides]|uniref:3-oxoacyl-ACP synthase n=1 Tax=Cereibacter sphaeroides TaxID=1063 RepID=UPI001F286215|nr:3-oxoacyl-ACP synthase [Cereibacter sphaeroides]MCE6950788.1 3-oxoacyl-ACP synthase [Cereibacter sphaeroides]
MTGAGRSPALTVTGYAIWAATGPDGPSCVAAMRAGVSGAAEANLWDSTAGAPLNACRVQAHQWWEGASFLPALLAPVIEDCRAAIEALPGGPRGAEVPVLLAVAPPDRPGRPEALERILRDGLAERLETPLPPGSIVLPAGRCALPQLFARAADLASPLAIVAGAESFLRQAIVEAYNRRGRLLSAVNSSGFIAGEAAAALIVARGRRPGLVLTGMGLGFEPSRDGGDKDSPVTGEGLTDAMRAALTAAGMPFHDINVLLSDQNGEHFKFKEHALALMRLDRVPPEGRSRRPRGHVEHWNVVETIGEVGAALMPAAMGWAWEAGRSGWLPGRVIFTAGEDDGRRAAVVGEWQDE